jgi:hypothetical protein
VGTAWNEFEREREERRGEESERRDGKGLWRSSVVFFGFAATHTTPKGERGGSFLPALGFSSFL